MKFDKQTLEILKSFALINNNLMIKEGSKLLTISPQKDQFVIAETALEFPMDFAIYDLISFINIIDSIGEPEVNFLEKSGKKVASIEGENGLKYTFYPAEENTIIYPSSVIDIDGIPNMIGEFSVMSGDMSRILKMSSISNFSHIKIYNDGGTLKLHAYDHEDKAIRNFLEFPVTETDEENEISTLIALDKLPKISGEYRVRVFDNKYVDFHNVNKSVHYLIAANYVNEKR